MEEIERVACVFVGLLLTLRGTPTCYYGDELGMENVPIPAHKIQDPPAVNQPEIAHIVGRDPERTPMQWDDSVNAGFAAPTVDDLWLPLAPDYKEKNVARELEDPRSFLNFYRKLVATRKASPALVIGDYRLLTTSPTETMDTCFVCLTMPPQYFPKNVLMNINGYESLDTTMHRAHKPYDAKSFEIVANETRALILDTRRAEEFAKGFIPNSINIGLEGNFASWVGELIFDLNQKILIVAEDNSKVDDAIIRLSRVGYDHAIGYLDGGFKSWKNIDCEIDRVQRNTAQELERKYKTEPNLKLIDVRKSSEYESEHIEGSLNIPLKCTCSCDCSYC